MGELLIEEMIDLDEETELLMLYSEEKISREKYEEALERLYKNKEERLKEMGLLAE